MRAQGNCRFEYVESRRYHVAPVPPAQPVDTEGQTVDELCCVLVSKDAPESTETPVTAKVSTVPAVSLTTRITQLENLGKIRHQMAIEMSELSQRMARGTQEDLDDLKAQVDTCVSKPTFNCLLWLSQMLVGFGIASFNAGRIYWNWTSGNAVPVSQIVWSVVGIIVFLFCFRRMRLMLNRVVPIIPDPFKMHC